MLVRVGPRVVASLFPSLDKGTRDLRQVVAPVHAPLIGRQRADWHLGHREVVPVWLNQSLTLALSNVATKGSRTWHSTCIPVST